MFPVAILAGGLATRLRPMTESIPKALLEVAGEPFISHQLCYLRDQGIESVVLCVGYLGQKIQDYVGSGSKWSINVSYSFDGPSLLGTGGALRHALPMLGEHFFILYGDSYLPISFREVQESYVASKKKGLMTVLKNENKWDKSNVEYCDGKIIEYNKKVMSKNMQHIDYGLGILSSCMLLELANSVPSDISDLYTKLSLTGELAAYEAPDRFYEIGSFGGIADAEDYFIKKNARGST